MGFEEPEDILPQGVVAHTCPVENELTRALIRRFECFEKQVAGTGRCHSDRVLHGLCAEFKSV
jgi:hypothetical protein